MSQSCVDWQYQLPFQNTIQLIPVSVLYHTIPLQALPGTSTMSYRAGRLALLRYNTSDIYYTTSNMPDVPQAIALYDSIVS